MNQSCADPHKGSFPSQYWWKLSLLNDTMTAEHLCTWTVTHTRLWINILWIDLGPPLWHCMFRPFRVCYLFSPEKKNTLPVNKNTLSSDRMRVSWSTHSFPLCLKSVLENKIQLFLSSFSQQDRSISESRFKCKHLPLTPLAQRTLKSIFKCCHFENKNHNDYKWLEKSSFTRWQVFPTPHRKADG